MSGPGEPNGADVPPGWVDWDMWDGIFRLRGVTVERSAGSAHPRYPGIIYPIDYGFVNDTLANDGEPVDVFLGSASSGLVAAVFTVDPRKGDREVKFLFNCSPQEIYLVHGFVNFPPMSARLLMRRPMHELW
jgi:inorganic pyrophosphatase